MFRLGIRIKTLSQSYLKAISKLSQIYRKSVFRFGILNQMLSQSYLSKSLQMRIWLGELP